MKLNLVQSYRGEVRWLAARSENLAVGADGPGLVDVTQNHSTEDRAVRIGVPGHHHELNGKVGFAHNGFQCSIIMEDKISVRVEATVSAPAYSSSLNL